MDALIQWIYTLVGTLGKEVIKLLPTSPFRQFIDNFEAPQYLGWLNWFFPISSILSVLALWVTAIGLFYLYSIIMRWVKMIGD